MLATDFAAAIAGAQPLPGRCFAVYRNNIASALANALAVRFPVVQRLVGEEFFAALAGEFARAHPPATPVFAEFGEALPEWLEGFAPAATVPYLADVARLENAWWRAYHAADAATVPPARFAAFSETELGALRIVPHPAAALVRSPWPILLLWRANKGDGDLSRIDLKSAEAVLVTRPRDEPVLTPLDDMQARFFERLLAGDILADAAENALAVDAGFNLAAALTALIASGIATDVSWTA